MPFFPWAALCWLQPSMSFSAHRLRRCCSVLRAVILLHAIALPAAAQTFRNPLRIPTEADPSSINVVDVNGDGHPDVLYGIATNITQHSTGAIHTLLWQPGNTFTSGPTLTLPSNTNTLCRTGDLNGDGIIDLLCPSVSVVPGNYSTTLVFFPGKGDGSFGVPTYSPVVQSNTGYSLIYPLVSTFADTNRDRHMDVLVTDVQAGVNYTMLGDGSGKFTFGGSGSAGNGVGQLLDVNKDGVPDLLLTNGPTVQLGKGDGTFGMPINGPGYFGCAYGDLDGDGTVDAACSNGPKDIAGLYILHGNGDGTFQSNPVAATTYGSGTAALATLSGVLEIRDLNADGRADLFGTAGDGWTTLLSQGGLRFSAPRHLAAGYGIGALIYSELYPQYGLADLDGDNIPDLVAAGANGVYISLSRAPLAQTPPEPIMVAEAGYRVGHAAVADFTGDGIPDVAASGSKNLTLSIGRGDGTFAAPVALANAGIDFSTPNTATQASLLSGDFDGDGKQDLLAVGSPSVYSNNVYLLRGHGDGTFSVPMLVRALGPFSSLPDRSVFDINHDGKDDLLDINSSSLKGEPAYISFALNAGNGTFQTVTTPITTESSDSNYNRVASFPALADFDQDGKADVVYAYIDNAYVMPGNGDGTFRAANTSAFAIPALPGKTTVQVNGIATGDFDGDGHYDFAVLTGHVPQGALAIANSSAVTVFYGNGDGTFAAPVQKAFTHTYTDVLGADVDKDGRADLLLHNGGSLYEAKGVALVHGTGNRILGAEEDYYAGAGLSNMIVSDLNRDGLPDLLFANGDLNVVADTVTVLMNIGKSVAGGGILTATPEPSTPGQSFDVVATLQPVPATVPTGSVHFLVDGADAGTAALSGYTARITYTGTLAVGTHTLAATWPGDTLHGAISLTGNHTVIAANVPPPPPPAPVATLSTLTAQPNPAYQGQTVVLRAVISAVTASVSAMPTGTVQFLDGNTVLGQAPYGNGSATLSTSSLALGMHTLTAVYSGDSTYIGSISAPLTETILPSGLVLSSNPATLLLATGHHLSFTLKASSVGAFTDTLRFTAHDLPTHATLQFTPATAALSTGSSVTASVYVDTSDVIGYLSEARQAEEQRSLIAAAGLLMLPLGLLLGSGRRRSAGTLLLVGLTLACLGSSGCSGKYPASVAPGQYTLQLVATGQNTGTVQTLDVPLTVTP